MAKNARFDLNTVSGLADAVSELQSETQQKRNFVRTVPNIAEVQEGELVPYDDGVNRRIYTKVNGVLYSFTLTAV